MNDAIIISDIHLGSDVCQSKKLVEFLNLIENGDLQTKELIVNGDLFDSWDFRKLKKSHWKVLSKIRNLSKKVHTVWINGNHDGPAEVISHLIGLDFVEEYALKSGDKKILILHGDIFDNFIASYPLLTKIADNAYRLIQKLDKSFYLAKLAKKSSKTFLRCSDQIKERAKIYGIKKHVDAVICSHTHLPLCDLEGSVKYYNTGCWTEDPCNYAEIKDGLVLIKNFTDIS
jgi:UDP-2,3-diacylglucosamine pyrophosphatase LpxH